MPNANTSVFWHPQWMGGFNPNAFMGFQNPYGFPPMRQQIIPSETYLNDKEMIDNDKIDKEDETIRDLHNQVASLTETIAQLKCRRKQRRKRRLLSTENESNNETRKEIVQIEDESTSVRADNKDVRNNKKHNKTIIDLQHQIDVLTRALEDHDNNRVDDFPLPPQKDECFFDLEETNHGNDKNVLTPNNNFMHRFLDGPKKRKILCDSDEEENSFPTEIDEDHLSYKTNPNERNIEVDLSHSCSVSSTDNESGHSHSGTTTNNKTTTAERKDVKKHSSHNNTYKTKRGRTTTSVPPKIRKNNKL